MKIKYTGLSFCKSSLVLWQKTDKIDSFFLSADNWMPTSIYINKKNPQWRMSLAHEIGHILSAKYFKIKFNSDNPIERLRDEIVAWRIAKSFIKTKYWHDHFAKNSIMTWIISLEIRLNTDKLKIIALEG